MAAIALILLGVLIGVLPARRSPYRLIISGIAVAAAPLGVASIVPGYLPYEPLPQPMNLTALVAALVVGFLLIAGAAVVAGLGPVVATVSAVAVFGATVVLSASVQDRFKTTSQPSLLTLLPIAGSCWSPGRSCSPATAGAGCAPVC
jgi:hypothetical protein